MHRYSCHGHEPDRYASRPRGGRGFRRGFFGLEGGAPGRRGGFPFGRFVGDGELRLILLALLADGPRHGYDLIKALEERSSGFYSPSPGVIYPTLIFLEEAGHASSTAEGNKKVYSISDAGQAHLAENRVAVDAILARIEWIGKRLAQARQWFEGRESEGGRDRDIRDAIPELNDARRELKAALRAKLGASEAEQRRVAEILQRAAKEIVGKDAEESDAIDL